MNVTTSVARELERLSQAVPGIAVVAIPLATDLFVVSGTSKPLPWSEVEMKRPVIPLLWWCNLPGNRPVADAVAWAGHKGYIRSGAATGVRFIAIDRLGRRLAEWTPSNTNPVHVSSLIMHLRIRLGEVRITPGPDTTKARARRRGTT
jgi:hypothetical protein